MDDLDLIVKMQFGSHVYGTSLPTSDLDYKAVYLPTADEILLQSVKPTRTSHTKVDRAAKNTAEDVDFEAFSLQHFLRLLLDGQTVQVSMLFTPAAWILEETDVWRLIQNRKPLWLHSGTAAFAGYCRQQANKYGIKGSRVAAAAAAVELFTRLIADHHCTDRVRDHWDEVVTLAQSQEHIAIIGLVANRMVEVCNRRIQEGTSLKEALAIVGRIHEEYGHRARQAQLNEGVDWKAMMHAVRVCREAQELLTTGHVTYPRPEANLLLRIRKGELPYADVAVLLEEGLDLLERCQRVSILPPVPDRAAALNFVREHHQEIVLRQALCAT